MRDLHTTLHRDRQRLTAVIDSLDRGLIVLDRNLLIEFANPEAGRILGASVEELRTWTVQHLLRCADGDPSLASILEDLAVSKPHGPAVRKVCEDGRLRRGDGQSVPVSASVIPVQHGDQLHGAVLVLADISERQHLELVRRMTDLRRQATTDDLTGLPNRRAFYAHVGAHLAEPHRVRAMLLLDLDGFKEVNDSLGHQIGDQLLVQVGARFAQQLRDGDMLARLGGDEFAVMLNDITPDEAVDVAGKLRAALAEPITLEGIPLRTDVSIGLSFSPEHGSELTVLLRRADIALYKAKSSRKGYHVYTGTDDTAGEERLRTLAELRTAIAENHFILHYQPQLDLSTNQVHCVEALVRWDHPTRGLLYPDSFLALAEEAGLMGPLTRIVLEQALHQARVWQRTGRRLTVAVNLSASSLIDTDLPDQIGALLAARRLPADTLQLEITEEFLMDDRVRAGNILQRLRDMGIQIALDDFGTGYSSLAYLRELPVDELKLDRSFVAPMASDPRAAALVFSTIALTHSLGLRMVAEGVEDELTLDELVRHGCDHAQGYYISRPIPAAALDVWLDHKAVLPVDSCLA
jgi:diguanylate cyclase (GGDEF)-like protein/PAS domain S-box-containing protein